MAGGGLAATAEDVAKFAVAYQRGALLKPSTARAAWGRQTTSDRKVTGYGLGWIVATTRGRDGGVPHRRPAPRQRGAVHGPALGLRGRPPVQPRGRFHGLLDLAREIASALLP